MSDDINRAELYGTIDRFREIPTKTGRPMTEVLLRVKQDRFRVLAFGNVAEALLAHCRGGDRLTVTGALTASSWKDEAGEWKYSFGVTAWTATLNDGEKVAYPPEAASKRNTGTGDYTPKQRPCRICGWSERSILKGGQYEIHLCRVTGPSLLWCANPQGNAMQTARNL